MVLKGKKIVYKEHKKVSRDERPFSFLGVNQNSCGV